MKELVQEDVWVLCSMKSWYQQNDCNNERSKIMDIEKNHIKIGYPVM
ncbi:hypothetical protein UC3_01060 [Enterococcus phoeniculicola ATCC BAA-412]|jgi:hypothetical protein|uniref:Uncharacterized protein n=1 Tax=Enterococcus phoeniculicola ATCC BAA-412 TaxID=1158610 RepID=R3TXB6_9ENTE|nr:hypothetical protein UC3_01060 [Enterococcus phoeniculicola ATCC BAA-412]EOT76901.1 hypothetical protein I589_01862 [Enterococcus phoeniculicola ATCC BAA-412]